MFIEHIIQILDNRFIHSPLIIVLYALLAHPITIIRISMFMWLLAVTLFLESIKRVCDSSCSCVGIKNRLDGHLNCILVNKKQINESKDTKDILMWMDSIQRTWIYVIFSELNYFWARENNQMSIHVYGKHFQIVCWTKSLKFFFRKKIDQHDEKNKAFFLTLSLVFSLSVWISNLNCEYGNIKLSVIFRTLYMYGMTVWEKNIHI